MFIESFAHCNFLSTISEAVPKRILELMNVPGLTRENVASHLQVCFFPLLLSIFHHSLCSFTFLFFFNSCFEASPSGLFLCKHWTCILGALKDALSYLFSSVAATFHAVIIIIWHDNNWRGLCKSFICFERNSTTNMTFLDLACHEQ